MVKKILIIRLSALGDVIFTLPVLEFLRRSYPDASIDWIVEDKAAGLLEHRNDLGRVIVYPRKELRPSIKNPLKWPHLMGVLMRHVSRIRKESYDLILDFQGNLKSGVHVLFSRGVRKTGFAREFVKEMNHLFTREHVTPPPTAKHRIEKNISLVDPDFEQKDITRPDLFLAPELVKKAEREIAHMRKTDSPLLIVHPGTSAFGAFKRWAPDHFGHLAEKLWKTHAMETLVTWGPGEEDLAREIAHTGGDSVIIAPPSRSLLHLAAYIRLGSVYVGADSGPLHMANYLGVPCVALFGPKDPDLYRPYFTPSLVVRANKDCSPCTKRHCEDPICMKDLDMEMVYDAVLKVGSDLIEIRSPGREGKH